MRFRKKIQQKIDFCCHSHKMRIVRRQKIKINNENTRRRRKRSKKLNKRTFTLEDSTEHTQRRISNEQKKNK